jgi:class 3 adenylate cyclase/tetratricopeptide (TPR) repeat protein
LVRCARCEGEADPSAKVCGHCGADLVLGCAHCGSMNPLAQKFCGECGAALGSRSSVPNTGTLAVLSQKRLADALLSSTEGERKQVSVLFADIQGSLQMFAEKDPEEVRRVLDPVLKNMVEAVHSYEGTVSRIMGDGIMATFGVPVAQEEHAILACYAALRMQEQMARLGEHAADGDAAGVRVRVGINSGEVVVRALGNDLHLDYATVGLAARVEQIATPGSIVVTADTMRLAEGYVEARSLGPVPIKGLPVPLEVFELTGASAIHSRLKLAAARGLTPFVGRARELDMLAQALGQAFRGAGQTIAVVGEPGVGKSRLVHEFLRSRQATKALQLESNAASYGRAIPYLPIVDLLKGYLKIEARDGAQTIREKVAARIDALDPGLRAAEGPVLQLLDALPVGHPFGSLDPQLRRQQTYDGITGLLLSESRIRPVIVVFEDLHWHDSLTLGLLDRLVSRAHDARLLVIASYRREHHSDWESLPGFREVRLEPLAHESVGELVEALLGPDPSLQSLRGFLLDRAGGNPFFLEELVRTLYETGVISGARGRYRLARSYSPAYVPPTIQAVIAARIDRLPKAERSVLQDAAVIGKDVPFLLLQEISGRSEAELRALLVALEAGEFVNLTRRFPDPEYSFKHSLTHEVAYSGLLKNRRRDIHARIVTAMEKLYADRIVEKVERLAEHAVRGELKEKALAYLRRAGAKAAEREAYREALVLLEQALRVLPELPETRETLECAVDLRFDIRNVLQPLGDREQIARYLREAEGLAERLGDARRIGWIQSYLTEQYWMLGRSDDAAAAGERALAIARELADLPLQVVTNLPLGLVYHTRGEYGLAMEYFRWNFQRLRGPLAHERFGMFVLPSSFSGSFLAWSLAEQGDFPRAADIAEDAAGIAEGGDHPFSRGYAQLGMGVVALRRGDLQEAIRAFERALAVGAFADSPVGFAYVAFHLGYALSLSGRVDLGIPLLERTISLAEARRFVARHSLRLAYLAEAYVLAGRLTDAESAAARAIGLAVEHGERANHGYALRVAGEVNARLGKRVEAEAHFRAGLERAQALGMRPLAAHCHRGLGAALEAKGAREPALSHQESAAALVEAMRMRYWDEPWPAESASKRTRVGLRMP